MLVTLMIKNKVIEFDAINAFVRRSPAHAFAKFVVSFLFCFFLYYCSMVLLFRVIFF